MTHQYLLAIEEHLPRDLANIVSEYENPWREIGRNTYIRNLWFVGPNMVNYLWGYCGYRPEESDGNPSALFTAVKVLVETYDKASRDRRFPNLKMYIDDNN